MAGRRRSTEDILNPERVFFRLIKDYSDGRFGNFQRIFYRAVVEAVDTMGGQLEIDPPNPPNSIRARVYTDALDANTPSDALTVFHPFFPPQAMPTIEVGEHVHIIFEDANFSNGYWLTQIPVFSALNFSSPDLTGSVPPTTADTFESRPAQQSSAPSPTEYSFNITPTEAETTRAAAQRQQPQDNFWQNKKVLHVGDSQAAGLFGRTVGDVLRSRGASLYTLKGRVGWGVISWLNGRKTPQSPQEPKLQDLIAQYQPDVVLITLGGNDYSRANSPDLINKFQEFWNIALTVPNQFWAGPPIAIGLQAPNQSARSLVSEKIAQVVGPKFLDSRLYTNVQGGRDRLGVHFTREGIETVERWANAFADKGGTT